MTTFPVYFHLLGVRLHPHLLFETLGYFCGARLYFWMRGRNPQAALPIAVNLWLLIGCLFGAWAGSKLLAWAESPPANWSLRENLSEVLGGKTIVGGLLGGWAGVEIAKRRCGISQSTGDAFVWPIALGTAIGRLGCFFTGLADHTYGIATRLPWGVDFGDGVRRHPTQLYESGFVLLLAGGISLLARRRPLRPGVRFRLYIVAYLGFRFFIEFIKPRATPWLGLSAIQLASIAGGAVAAGSLILSHGSPLFLRRADE